MKKPNDIDELYREKISEVISDMANWKGFYVFPVAKKFWDCLDNPTTAEEKMTAVELLKRAEKKTKSSKLRAKLQTERFIRDIDLAIDLKYQHLKDVLKEDVKELNTCYSNGAYKATLILAGSIMEAFLLDWLSEIDGKDYFRVPFKVWDEHKKKYVKKEELCEYIKAINSLKYPDWMETNEKATFIRKKRNLVHAKLCLKEEVGINEKTCAKVITYLLEVIGSRFTQKVATVENSEDEAAEKAG